MSSFIKNLTGNLCAIGYLFVNAIYNSVLINQVMIDRGVRMFYNEMKLFHNERVIARESR